MNRSITWSSAPAPRSPAYPFYWCMVKQAALMAGAVLLFAGGILAGHFATTGWPGPGSWSGARQPLQEVAMEKLTCELDLTPAQVERLTPVIAEACANLRLLSEEHRAQRLALIDEISTTIAPDLSPDQQRRLEALEAEYRNRTPVKHNMRLVALF